MNEEFVPGGRAISQSDTAKTYRCPVCQRPIFSQYEGDDDPVVVCEGNGDHRLQWRGNA
jgi:hypothetical protein